MSTPRVRKSLDEWNGVKIPPGSTREVRLATSESYSGTTLKIPIRVQRAKVEGPTVFVTAALHGDEINGTGAVRQLIQDPRFRLIRGSVILVPVLNILGFDRHSRYLPDRRDLNRSFPGSPTGSLASRMANTIFREIVMRCDYGIDLHTASVRRTNFPNVRGDLTDPRIQQFARSFGSEIIIHGHGPEGALRREACTAGVPTIIMEGGEVWKVEPVIVAAAVRGIKNALIGLGMLDGEPERPPYQVEIEHTKWIRAERGGFLQFHVQPGDIVEQDQPLATNTNLLGREKSYLCAPFPAVVVGMTTLPAVSPGEPVCHLGRLPDKTDPSKFRRLRQEESGLEEKMMEDLASNVLVVDPPEDREI